MAQAPSLPEIETRIAGIEESAANLSPSSNQEDIKLDVITEDEKLEHVRIRDRNKYRDEWLYQDKKSIVLIKDVENGYIYVNGKGQVCNDGKDTSILTDFHLWQIITCNLKNVSKKKDQNTKQNVKIEKPKPKQKQNQKEKGKQNEKAKQDSKKKAGGSIFLIKNVGNSCYLLVDHKIDAKVESHTTYDDWGSDYPAYTETTYKVVDNSVFQVLCDKNDKPTQRYWQIKKSPKKDFYGHGNDTPLKQWVLDMVDEKCQLIQDQYLTFETKVTGYSHIVKPKHTKLNIFFDNTILRNNTSIKSKVSDQLFQKHRRLKSVISRSINVSIKKRTGFKHTCTFTDKSCIVMLKDETLKKFNSGYIYFDPQTNTIRNDATNESIFTNFLLWEMTIVNKNKLQKSMSQKKLENASRSRSKSRSKSKSKSKADGNDKKTEKKVCPIVYFKNIGCGCYLSCNNEIKVEEKLGDDNQARFQDNGSRFKIVCRDTILMKKSHYKWLVDQDDTIVNGLCTLRLVNNKHKPIKNQFLTFGKGVKISDDRKTWRLPKMSQIKIFV